MLTYMQSLVPQVECELPYSYKIRPLRVALQRYIKVK